MACGLPIIESEIRGNTDLIDPPKGGYLVNAVDIQGFVNAIQKVTNDEKGLAEMKSYNYMKIQDYGEKAVLRKMSALYQSMM